MVQYKKDELLGQLDSLGSIIENPVAIACFDKCGLDSGKLLTLLERVKNFSSKWNKTLYCNHDENPSELIKKWVGLLEEDKDEHYNGLVNEVKSLYRRTEKFLRSLLSIPYKEKAVRMYSSKSLAVVMERTADENAKISAQLEKEKKKEQPDEEVIQNLEKLKVASDKEIENLYKERSLQELEEASEKVWSEKIKDTFDQLRRCTVDIEEEKRKADTEYHLFLYGLILPSIVLLIWLCKLYGFISGNSSIDNWIGFIPYYLPVPIFVALFWLFIVQKNRAGKISIALSERLFQIKYLEGLMIAVNRLSTNSQDAIEMINRSIDKMVNGYLLRVTKDSVDELRLNEIEKKEVNEEIYMKIINKLAEIIKK